MHVYAVFTVLCTKQNHLYICNLWLMLFYPVYRYISWTINYVPIKLPAADNVTYSSSVAKAMQPTEENLQIYSL